MPNTSGHGQQFGFDLGQEALDGACAVVFQSELAFESRNGFNPLPDTTQSTKPWGFVFAIWSQQCCLQIVGNKGFEDFAGDPLTTQDHRRPTWGADQYQAHAPEMLVRQSAIPVGRTGSGAIIGLYAGCECFWPKPPQRSAPA